jgi:hypothetical protein
MSFVTILWYHLMYLMVVITISYHIHFFTIMCSPFFFIGSIGMFHGSIDRSCTAGG